MLSRRKVSLPHSFAQLKRQLTPKVEWSDASGLLFLCGFLRSKVYANASKTLRAIFRSNLRKVIKNFNIWMFDFGLSFITDYILYVNGLNATSIIDKILRRKKANCVSLTFYKVIEEYTETREWSGRRWKGDRDSGKTEKKKREGKNDTVSIRRTS